MCEGAAAMDPVDELRVAVARFMRRKREEPRDAWQAQLDLGRTWHLIDTLRVDFARDAERFAESMAWDEQGLTSPSDWLTVECHMTGAEAWGALCVGRNAGELVRTVEKVEAGSLGYAHLLLMARTNDALKESGARLDEARLLKRAETKTPSDFRRVCSHARHAADAAAFQARQQECADERFLELKACGGDDGGIWLRGYIDAIGGATLRAALEPLTRPLGADDARPRSRRLADALIEMSAYTLNTGGQGTTHCQVPHLQITATLETLTGAPGAPAGELEGAVPISAAEVERYSCSASVRRVLLDSESLPFDVGRARRMPATATRIKVEHRDRGCVWPGCTRTVRWAEPHHVQHWTRDRGSTEDANLVLLCWKHHDDVHLRGWRIVRVADQREVLTIAPIALADPLNRGPSNQHAA